MTINYRTDIDGLRAIAVTSVILFHLGYLTNGYLGVDIFFAITGFLITTIIYTSSENGSFSILKFYERRIRRIIPLLLFITLIALLIGIVVMLPEDLENLSQSVIASNLSVNNILMYITSGNYWATKNDYKPLMHTWSLGVEEQFYLIYPFIFYFFQGKKSKFSVYLIVILTVLSLIAFFVQDSYASKFYLIQYRFFELSIGGLGAIYLLSNKEKANKFDSGLILTVLIGITLLLLAVPISPIRPYLNLFITISSVGILVIGSHHYNKTGIYQSIFSNKLLVGLGKISFSVYMWHQLILAFARYTFIEEMTLPWSLIIILVTIILSLLTYTFIESPFRNHQLIRTRYVITACATVLLLTTIPAFYIHSVTGIIKDCPELGLTFESKAIRSNLFTSNRNASIKYIDDIDALDKDFSSDNKVKVLVIGNSFGRDVSNILLEYDSAKHLEISYLRIENIQRPKLKARLIAADLIILAAKDFLSKDLLTEIEQDHNLKIDRNEVWVFGTKDFGLHNGIHHNRYKELNRFNTYRTKMKAGVAETNNLLQAEWGNRYVNLISLVSDDRGKILVYTPEGRFLSHDTIHLTKAGAQYFARKLKHTLDTIFAHH